MTTHNPAATAHGHGSAASTPTRLLRAVRAKFGRWREAGRIRAELEQLYPRELADLGLSPSDIPAVARGTYRRG